MNNISIVEAVLFSSDEPMKIAEFADLTGLEPKEVAKALRVLMKKYNNDESAIVVQKVKNKYVMQLKEEYLEYGYKVGRPELNQDMLKTLAVIAYYQPIKQKDLRELVGEKIYEHVDFLRSKNLVYTKKTGKTFELSTTKHFSEYFGIDAKSKEEIKQFLSKKLNLELK